MSDKYEEEPSAGRADQSVTKVTVALDSQVFQAVHAGLGLLVTSLNKSMPREIFDQVALEVSNEFAVLLVKGELIDELPAEIMRAYLLFEYALGVGKTQKRAS